MYNSDSLAFAQVEKPEHAEWRVLKDLKLSSSKDNLLVIYSFASPCSTTCTNLGNDYNIIKVINKVTANWNKYAFVSDKIFKPESKNIEMSVLIKALEELGKSKIGLENIFRCFKPLNSDFKCISCSSSGEVTKECADYEA